mmetsp:Transcript_41774/g.63792  ORF Transcript_41774/g.63792 Transcript_41774/m.63792 type:complete len:86 (-) Transcript_41774:3-260(-)
MSANKTNKLLLQKKEQAKLMHTKKHLLMGHLACPIIKISDLNEGVQRIGAQNRHKSVSGEERVVMGGNRDMEGEGLIFEQSEEDD